jgi:ABC-type multidrug transport system fused ATPase/permease subunit
MDYTLESIHKLLIRLWAGLPIKRRREFLLLVFLMFVSAIFELIGIGMVFPFISAITNPEKVFNMPSLATLIELLGIEKEAEILPTFTAIFAISAVLTGFFRVMVLQFSSRFSFSTGADIGLSIFTKTLYQPYSSHISRNSSEVIDGVTGKVASVVTVLNMGLIFLSSVIILTAITIFVFIFNPVITILALLGFGSIYLVIILVTRKRTLLNSSYIANESIRLIKVLQEGLGGIRDVIIDKTQDLYCKVYEQSSVRLRRAQAQNHTLSVSPKYCLEALGLTLIAFFAYYLARKTDGASQAMPILGALALSAQRLLPLLQQIYSSYTVILGEKSSLSDALKFMDQSSYFGVVERSEKVKFDKTIRFCNINFKYDASEVMVLKGVNYDIKKGSRIGIIGETGSGKSTLLDILMGLLIPQDGFLEVDGKKIERENVNSWQTHIAHVPQSIFLTDSSIEENIAFGVSPELIDKERLFLAARKAQLEDFIQGLPNKYKTVVGERGVKLSGGQRQRIGIARALYKKADVIIFDEATSALDNETESSVMSSINALEDDLTIFIVAHRLTSLSACSSILEIRNGIISRDITYAQLTSPH